MQLTLKYMHTFNDIVKIQHSNSLLLTLKLAWIRKVNKESGSYDYRCINNIKGYHEVVLFCLK